MASRKLARDVFLLTRKPLFTQLLSSHLETSACRILLVAAANGSLFNRRYSVVSDFSRDIKDEASSNKGFEQSMKELQEKAEALRGAKDELKVRMQQTNEQLYKHVDGIWTEAEATAKKISSTMADKYSTTKAEVKQIFDVGEQEFASSSGTSKFTSAADGSYAKEGCKTENSREAQPGHGDTAGELYGSIKSFVNSTLPKVSLAFQKLKGTKIFDLVNQGYEIVKEDLTGKPKRRKRFNYAASSSATVDTSARSELVIITSRRSVWSEKMDALKQKVQDHPIYKEIEKKSKPVVTRTQEYVEDLQEMWETSDNPIVHKIQDLNEKVWKESDGAMAFKEIRQRDHFFSLPDFVAEVEETIEPILKAHIKGDFEVLQKYCSPRFVERCKAEHKAYKSQGIIFDDKILHVSEAYVEGAKMIEGTPVIILKFQTQQVQCIRDARGSVREGSKDNIQTVHYAWALQQTEEDGIYDMWRLMEMQKYGIAALI